MGMRNALLTSRGAWGVWRLRGRNEFFLNRPEESVSATYFHRRPSISSQQIHRRPADSKSGGGVVVSKRGEEEAKLALIRSVSRTRISWGEEDAIVLLGGDCFFMFIGFGAITVPVRHRERERERDYRQTDINYCGSKLIIPSFLPFIYLYL